MGDRTFVNINFHPEDLNHPALKSFLDNWGEGAYSDDPTHHFYEEVNYAGYTDLEALAEAGVRFVGFHGAGGEYGAFDFFHDGLDPGIVHYNPDQLWSVNNIVVDVSSGWPTDGAIRVQVDRLARWNKIWRTINEFRNTESTDTISPP